MCSTSSNPKCSNPHPPWWKDRRKSESKENKERTKNIRTSIGSRIWKPAIFHDDSHNSIISHQRSVNNNSTTTMKLNLSLLFSLLVTGANAFSAKPPGRAVRPDTSAAVEEALKVTAAFGINSNEARIAWETVEEMDSADNR